MRGKVETCGEDGEWTDWAKDVEDAGKTVERAYGCRVGEHEGGGSVTEKEARD